MQVEDIKLKLEAALDVRHGLLDPNMGMRERIEAMEQYMHDTAYHRGELEECLYWINEAEKVLRRRWDSIEGWEPLIPKAARSGGPTQESIRLAKRKVDQDTHDALDDAKRTKELLARQIRRFEIDYETLSRVYTMMTGG